MPGGSTFIIRLVCALTLVGVAAVALVGAAAGDAVPISIQGPAPGSVLTVEAGKRVSFTVSAAAAPGTVLRLRVAHLPRGASFTVKGGNPASGVFSWRPTGPQIGERPIAVAAQANVPAGIAPATLPLTLQVVPGYARLTSPNADGSHWAFVATPNMVRSAPSFSASAVGRIGLWTPENYPNLVTLLEQKTLKSGTWVHVRFPKLPNNTTGWVKRGALGAYHALTTHLIIDRATTMLTLYKAGAVLFQARVGVGQSRWPTPRGEFYVTEKLTGFHDPAYGPIAFGTSARSAVLTDWPGGGFIGIHGTDAPGLIPGHISHGCVRLRNAAIVRLARLLPLGTPVSIQ